MKRKFLFVLITLILVVRYCMAAVSNQLVQRLTEEVRAYDSKWSNQKSKEILDQSKTGTGTYVINGDHGMVCIVTMGNTVLVNGKDISGNLGSKTTYGANSHIMGDVKNSQIISGDISGQINQANQAASGPNSAISQENTRMSLTVSLSIVLCFSMALSLYLWRKLRIATKKK